MNGYTIPKDGNLHVNYSTLKRCTSAKSVLAVVQEMRGERRRFEGNESMRIGHIRHQQWEEEAKRTHKTPLDFKREYRAKADFIEQEFAAIIFEGVMLHFRPDVVSLQDEAVIDYKKVVKGAHQFLNDHQLIIYAYGLQLHGYRIRKAVHLCELWNKEGSEIIGYQALERPLKLRDISLAPKWLRVRANYLVQAKKVLT